MNDNSIYWSDLFKSALLKHCSSEFISASTIFFEDRINVFKYINSGWIDVTEYLLSAETESRLNRIKFIMVWLNTFISNDNKEIPLNAIVRIKDREYSTLHRLSFLSYLYELNLLSVEEKNSIEKEWLCGYNGVPYYK